MNNLFGLVKVSACVVGLMFFVAPSYAQMDPTDPWQRDRAAHQERMDKNLKTYKDRWPVYYEERYQVDAVGVIDKKGAREEFDKENAPVELEADDAADEKVEVDTKAVSEDGSAL